MHRSKQIPGPGQYNTTNTITSTNHKRVRGGKFSTGNTPSELDKAIRKAYELPGPGEYAGGGENVEELVLPFLKEFKVRALP